MITQLKIKTNIEIPTSHAIPVPCRATHRDAAVAAVKPAMAAIRAFLFPATCRLHTWRCEHSPMLGASCVEASSMHKSTAVQQQPCRNCSCKAESLGCLREGAAV